MSSFFLPYLKSHFHTIRHGTGEELLICLHGFGENATSFSRLQHSLGVHFTIVSLDLPLHGQTEWREERPFTMEDLKAVILLMLQHYHFKTFSLAGYSMGGRVSLCVVQQLAERIDRLYLLAPDGLKDNRWHMFATQTALGKRLFKYCTYHPQLFYGLLHLGRKLRFISRGFHKFTYNSMDTLAKRERVYFVWTCMGQMLPDRDICKQQLKKYRVQTLLLFGKYDRVIPPALGVRFMDGTFPCEMQVLECGHHLINDDAGDAMLSFSF
ncbi:alpha/beta fold hydrolase [Chitinophaga rhizophila]|uniref:Alpha/beta hydrolase n=1 Tax=Chitinophaga rhizophila TaxID=2866212 RepID=A0ABS7GFE4_9BACT|nr:alpha/beta hydrolase [Chitinophaga rhizophila]MBW8686396.1 alpha/beta hydrolase [Chitinophaga rhizophila]